MADLADKHLDAMSVGACTLCSSDKAIRSGQSLLQQSKLTGRAGAKCKVISAGHADEAAQHHKCRSAAFFAA